MNVPNDQLILLQPEYEKLLRDIIQHVDSLHESHLSLDATIPKAKVQFSIKPIVIKWGELVMNESPKYYLPDASDEDKYYTATVPYLAGRVAISILQNVSDVVVSYKVTSNNDIGHLVVKVEVDHRKVGSEKNHDDNKNDKMVDEAWIRSKKEAIKVTEQINKEIQTLNEALREKVDFEFTNRKRMVAMTARLRKLG